MKYNRGVVCPDCGLTASGVIFKPLCRNVGCNGRTIVLDNDEIRRLRERMDYKIRTIRAVHKRLTERDKLINALRFYAPHGEWGADTGTPQKGKGEPIVFTDVDGTERKIDYAPIDATLSELEEDHE